MLPVDSGKRLAAMCYFEKRYLKELHVTHHRTLASKMNLCVVKIKAVHKMVRECERC